MTLPFFSSLHAGTPIVSTLNNRGHVVREILFHRHSDAPNVTDERITRHQYDVRGHWVSSIDPRLYEAMQQSGSEIKSNFRYHHALSGAVLKTESVDAGTISLLNDAAGRPVVTRNAEGVITRWHYEPDGAGRLLSIREKAGGKENITERFVYAKDTPGNRAHNLVGTLVAHYDTVGVTRTESLSLAGVVLSVTQQLLKDEKEANWQGEEVNGEAALAGVVYQTTTTTDSAGAVLNQTDAKGNIQRHTYDIAGMLNKSTLTLKGESTATALFKKVTYSASGQKQQEVHGNGIISTYAYESETQRLIAIKVERPASHPKGKKVFQDLHYTYDPVGNVLSVENKAEEIRFFRNKKIAPKNTYYYDTLYQLVMATGREMASGSGTQLTLPETVCPLSDNTQYSAYIRDYDYDRGGNLTQIRHHAPETNQSHTTDILISTKSNRGVLKTAGLIAENVDKLFHPGGHQKALLKGQALNWTQRGELANVKMTDSDTETYHYDANSQRVTKITTRHHSGSVHTEKVIYLGNLEIRTRHQGGKLKEELHRMSVGNIQFLHWETGKPADIDNHQQRHSHGDIINSRGLELDQNGELVSQEEYYPYGGTALFTARNKMEASYKTIRYSGKERDATGLYYYGYRYYQPWLARWLSSDPAGTVDGLNLYRMVRNNPVTLWDNDGLTPEIAFHKGAKLLDQYIPDVKLLYEAALDLNMQDLSQVTKIMFDDDTTEKVEAFRARIHKMWSEITDPNFREKIRFYVVTATAEELANNESLNHYKNKVFMLTYGGDSLRNNAPVISDEEGKNPKYLINITLLNFNHEKERYLVHQTLVHEQAHGLEPREQSSDKRILDYFYIRNYVLEEKNKSVGTKFLGCKPLVTILDAANGFIKKHPNITVRQRLKDFAQPFEYAVLSTGKISYKDAAWNNAEHMAYAIQLAAYINENPKHKDKIAQYLSQVGQDPFYNEAIQFRDNINKSNSRF